jgi:hypothetical protein
MFPSPLLLQRLAEIYIKDALCEVEKARMIQEAKRYQRSNEQQTPTEGGLRRLLARSPIPSRGKPQPAHGLTSVQVCCIVIDLRNSSQCRTHHETATVC